MFRKFIERPVLSTVISIILVILGVLGITTLPIEQYPDIAPPTIRVSANYTGADAQTVLNSVVIPLEEQINGVEDMIYMSSTASNNGSGTIQVYFKQGTDPDMASVNVQNRVARANALLPAEVTRAGVLTAKRQNNMLMVFSLYSKDGRYDETFLQNYSKINLLPQVQRINGVGEAMVFGRKDYSMRIWLKPDIMSNYNLIPADVVAALNAQNLEAAPGRFGSENGQSFEYVIRYRGKLTQPEEFENIVIKSDEDGNILRLGDVARVEFGSLDYTAMTQTQGQPGISMAIFQSAGSNAREVILEIERTLEEASKSFPPGVDYMELMNTNEFLDASIEKVLHTLLEAFVLVFIVVFVFLQNFRATLIPAIAVPVSIIGTFFFLNLFGFTINLLTLFALVLAIGIVVDDAIVVVEAVHAKLDSGARSAKNAAISAMNEISTAIISITLVMAAVFIPVTFITGTTGVFYKQFGITLTVAIILSAVNALTLSPALCALFLKPHSEEEKEKKGVMKRFYIAFNTAFESMTGKYKKVTHFFINKKLVAGTLIIIFVALLGYLMKTTSTGFVPSEDTGRMFVDIAMPPASSSERTAEVAKQVDALLETIPEINGRTVVTGFSFMGGQGSPYAMVIAGLKPFNERKGEGQDLNSVVQKLYMLTSQIKGARIIIFSPPMVPGFSVTGGFELQLEDKTGGDIHDFEKVANNFLGALNQRPEIQYARTAFNTNFPQYRIDVDAARCMRSGLQVSSVLSAMQGYIGGYYASDFNRFGKQYRVMVQSEAKYRGNPEDLNTIKVRTATGEMAPISEFITLTRVYGPETINRFNMYTAISVNGSPNPGYSSGDAIDAVREVAAEMLPTGYAYEFSGLTREEVSAGNQTIIIFILSLIFVYFLLAAQYESYIMPLSIIVSLPIGIAGSFIFARILGVENNIYLQISLVMLIGLLAKNAILIVEFARQRRESGMSIIEAAVEGATARLRPILMTSFAFIVGLIPLVIGTGVGANGNRSIGTGAVGGMLIGTLIGILVIPAMFVVFQILEEKVTKPKEQQEISEMNSLD
ncbi:hydrophobic/amphiphilic exporter-1, HAE1 family [Draconibacterium orientale]|uniref:Hydrophobic/amphiphilic exporter-1, HAE1 family n=1 Tax=Draconibacterium orientale TaxID=1168034 RepID=X5E0B9_9BACT|nr:efflux RND transporter permease subunit [Draconibacterium orientale]AHW60011.1 multidrug transporter AcrB [Draconibacterium orientale]SEU09925.1 hydrophobic/amphiphilic exporter-1, HAE1 family [Draconibacterium orientale]